MILLVQHSMWWRSSTILMHGMVYKRTYSTYHWRARFYEIKSSYSQPQCHIWIQPCGKLNTNGIWPETNQGNSGNTTGKKIAAQEILFLILEKNQCEPTSKKTARNMTRISGPQIVLSLQIYASGMQITSFFVKTTTLQLIPVAFSTCLTSSVAMDIGFDDCVTSVSDAVAKHISHQVLWKYAINIIREAVLVLNKTLNPPLHCFCTRLIKVKLRDMTTFPVKSLVLLI